MAHFIAATCPLNFRGAAPEKVAAPVVVAPFVLRRHKARNLDAGLRGAASLCLTRVGAQNRRNSRHIWQTVLV